MKDEVSLRLRLSRLLARVLLPRPSASLAPDEVRRVLVYGGMGIGNMIMFTPALRAIREGLPRAHITVLTGASGSDQVVAGGPLVDEIIKVGGGMFERFLLGLKI